MKTNKIKQNENEKLKTTHKLKTKCRSQCFFFRNRAALTELFQLTGGRIIRAKRFLKQAKTWTDKSKLSWSFGDVEPFCNRIRIQQMHVRDAKRGGKAPPASCQQFGAVLNLVHKDTVDGNDDEDEDEPEAVDLEKEPPKKKPNVHFQGCPEEMTLEKAREILARARAHPNGRPARELIAVSSDEGANGPPAVEPVPTVTIPLFGIP
jgi:hypothetical protein